MRESGSQRNPHREALTMATKKKGAKKTKKTAKKTKKAAKKKTKK